MNRSLNGILAIGLVACQAESPPPTVTPADQVNDIADRYYAWTIERQPEQAYFSAIELERHDGLYDNTPNALGEDFDIQEFHDRVLENGTIPLGYLRQHIEAWIESKQNL